MSEIALKYLDTCIRCKVDTYIRCNVYICIRFVNYTCIVLTVN